MVQESLIDAAELRLRQRVNVDSGDLSADTGCDRQIKEIARRGFAYGILPRMAIDEEVRSGRLRQWPIARPVLRREVYLAYSKERPLLTPARAVGQLSWKVLRQLVHSGAWNARWIGDSDTPALYPVK